MPTKEGMTATMATKRKPKLLPPGVHEMRVGESFNVPDGCHARFKGIRGRTVTVVVFAADEAAYLATATDVPLTSAPR